MKKKIILFIGILFAISNIYAQNVTFTAKAPSAVVNGSQFRVEYTVNANGKDFRVDEFDGFGVLMGPSTSRSQNVQIMNGKMESFVTNTFTYVLQAQKEGTFTIPAASITVDNQKYFSNSLNITVLPHDSPNVSQGGGSGSSQSSSSSSQQNVGGVEAFVRVIPSKTTVYEQEAILVTYKFYVRGVDVSRFTDAKFPETKGFLSQEIQLPDDKQLTPENYNDKNYNTVVLKQTLLFPQSSGELEIESGKFDVVLRVPTRTNSRRSFFDDFFNTYQEANRSITSPAIKINVKKLPVGKPKSYANAVGDFSIKSSINTTKLKVNEPVTIKISISGNGNLRVVKNPEIAFPADFEIYDPKVESNLKNTTSGVTGTKTIEYLAIPRYAGTFTIPAVEFSYFDLKSQTYKTLKTESYTINVEKGEGDTSSGVVTNFSNKESLKFLGSDIRYIDTQHTKLKPKANFFYGSLGFVLCYLIPILLAIVLFIIFRKQAKENANIALVRTKKANKVATKRLKVAQKYLQQGEKENFYDEVLKALWGYFSDKLNIPLSDLTKDNIETELSKVGVDDALISEFKDILSTCEYARYAPGSGNSEMDQLYNKTVEKMSELEDKIKK